MGNIHSNDRNAGAEATRQIIENATAADDRFKDKSYAIHQIRIDTFSEAARTEAKVEKITTKVHTYLNSLHLMYPSYRVSKGNWLVAVKGDKELPPSPRLFEVWHKGCYAQIIRPAGAEEETKTEDWEVIGGPDNHKENGEEDVVANVECLGEMAIARSSKHIAFSLDGANHEDASLD